MYIKLLFKTWVKEELWCQHRILEPRLVKKIWDDASFSIMKDFSDI